MTKAVDSEKRRRGSRPIYDPSIVAGPKPAVRWAVRHPVSWRWRAGAALDCADCRFDPEPGDWQLLRDRARRPRSRDPLRVLLGCSRDVGLASPRKVWADHMCNVFYMAAKYGYTWLIETSRPNRWKLPAVDGGYDSMTWQAARLLHFDEDGPECIRMGTRFQVGGEYRGAGGFDAQIRALRELHRWPRSFAQFEVWPGECPDEQRFRSAVKYARLSWAVIDPAPASTDLCAKMESLARRLEKLGVVVVFGRGAGEDLCWENRRKVLL